MELFPDELVLELSLTKRAKLMRLHSLSNEIINPNPTLFETREAAEPYSRGQWDSALKATPHSPKGDVSCVRALEPTARSGAHGFRSRRPRSLLTVLNCCRIEVNSMAH
jgi:hypothetical protein